MSKDTIYRQDAIDALKIFIVIGGRENEKSVALKIANEYANIVKKKIEQLPSAEITYDDVMDYCKPRHLVLTTAEFLEHCYNNSKEE